MNDICENRHGGNRESVGANPSRLKKAQDRELIKSLVKESHDRGLTLDEASETLGVPPNNISGRFTELCAEGVLVKTSIRRPTRSGKSATVYIFTTDGKEQFAA